VPAIAMNAGHSIRSGRRPAGLPWRRTDGSQLLEFAMVLPFLVVLAMGAFDFGAGFLMKQKLTNSAREGARISAQLALIDLTRTDCPSTGAAAPCTVDAVRNAVVAYMQNANLDTSFIPANPTQTGPTEWTYSSTADGQAILVIDRDYIIIDPNGVAMRNSRVVVNYPYTWSFAQIVKLLSASASFPSSMLISGEALMKNLASI